MNATDVELKLTDNLKNGGIEHPGLEARLLLKTMHEAKEITNEQVAHLEGLCARRIAGEPMAYILGHKGFYKWDFQVQPGVLIPRPESEHIVEQALKLSRDPETIADLGCGSGILGISIAKEWLAAQVMSVDVSPIAVEVTRVNAMHLGVGDRVQVVCRSVTDFLPGQFFDLVVANPPYIADGDELVAKDVHKFEPHLALYSGPKGTERIHEWSRWAYKFLKPGGWWIFEFGAGQKEQVEEIILQIGFCNLEFTQDLQGIDRVCSAQKIKGN